MYRYQTLGRGKINHSSVPKLSSCYHKLFNSQVFNKNYFMC